jgi:hypothetical protein
MAPFWGKSIGWKKIKKLKNNHKAIEEPRCKLRFWAQGFNLPQMNPNLDLGTPI